MDFTPLGDCAVTITLASTADEEAHRTIRAAVQRLSDHSIPGIIDLVPAFTSIVVHYDPVQVRDAAAGPAGQAGPPGAAADARDGLPYDLIIESIRSALDGLTAAELPPPRVVEIPVCYGGDLGPDLDDIAQRHSLSPDEIIRLHAAGDYLVHMVGFMPGFAYLGGLDPRLATPRRSSPRTVVPAGSVGIGGSQTGVYPLPSPGGWNLIGRTPIAIFDPLRTPPTLLGTGDRVRFRAISRAEYDSQLAARDAVEGERREVRS